METNMWENSLKNIESDNKFFYEILLDFLERKVIYFLNKPRFYVIQLF